MDAVDVEDNARRQIERRRNYRAYKRMANINDKDILLIGGSGFLGRALSHRLHELGYGVHVVTRGNALDFADNVRLHGGGMENAHLLRSLIPEFKTVIHVASGTTPGLSNRAPSLEGSMNITPTLILIEELQRNPHVKLLYVSSGGTIYGNPQLEPVPESTELRPLSYYGAGKAAIEGFLNCLHLQSGNPVVILRPANLYGPWQPLYQGFGVIRTMLQHLRNDSAMTVWGDGANVRDYLYTKDMVSAIECVLANANASGSFNVGNGVGYSLNELIRIAENISGTRLSVLYEPSRGIDVSRVVLDITSIHQRFGWTPVTGLESGIAKTWEWLCSQGER